jgi:hypothetical protein
MRSLGENIQLGRGVAPVLYDIVAVSAAAMSPPDGEKRVSAELGSQDAQGQGLGHWVVVGRKLHIALI